MTQENTKSDTVPDNLSPDSADKEYDQLLTDLMLRIKSLEDVLVAKELIKESELAESLINTMIKFQEHLDKIEEYMDKKKIDK